MPYTNLKIDIFPTHRIPQTWFEYILRFFSSLNKVITEENDAKEMLFSSLE